MDLETLQRLMLSQETVTDGSHVGTVTGYAHVSPDLPRTLTAHVTWIWPPALRWVDPETLEYFP